MSPPARDGRGRPDASREPRNAKTTALPSGSSPTLIGNRTPRKSEKTPNQEHTAEAASRVFGSGESPKTTGRRHGPWPAGSKNGIGRRARSLGKASFVPAKSIRLCASIVIHAAAALVQA